MNSKINTKRTGYPISADIVVCITNSSVHQLTGNCLPLCLLIEQVNPLLFVGELSRKRDLLVRNVGKNRFAPVSAKLITQGSQQIKPHRGSRFQGGPILPEVNKQVLNSIFDLFGGQAKPSTVVE